MFIAGPLLFDRSSVGAQCRTVQPILLRDRFAPYGARKWYEGSVGYKHVAPLEQKHSSNEK